MIKVGKKNPFVFTIGFDKKNPEHQEVVEILNQTEKKASLIAEAVLQFMGRKSGNEYAVTNETVHSMIRAIVQQEMSRLIQETSSASVEKPESEKPAEESIRNLTKEDGPPIGDDMMREVASAMAAFQNL